MSQQSARSSHSNMPKKQADLGYLKALSRESTHFSEESQSDFITRLTSRLVMKRETLVSLILLLCIAIIHTLILAQAVIDSTLDFDLQDAKFSASFVIIVIIYPLLAFFGLKKTLSTQLLAILLPLLTVIDLHYRLELDNIYQIQLIYGSLCILPALSLIENVYHTVGQYVAFLIWNGIEFHQELSNAEDLLKWLGIQLIWIPVSTYLIYETRHLGCPSLTVRTAEKINSAIDVVCSQMKSGVLLFHDLESPPHINKTLLDHLHQSNVRLPKNLEDASSLLEEYAPEPKDSLQVPSSPETLSELVSGGLVPQESQKLGLFNVPYSDVVYQVYVDELSLQFPKHKVILLQFEDISEVKANQRENEHKSVLMRTVAHDLRSPMHCIQSMLELMQDHCHPTGKNFLTKAERGLKYTLSLINDICDFFQVSNGSFQVQIQPTSLKGIIEDSIDMMKFAVSEKVEVKSEYLGDTPKLINTDPRRVQQILINLLSNASKFTKEGSIIVEVRGLSVTRFRISVKDTGIGITDEDQAKILKPFGKGNDKERNPYGNGLGLSITDTFCRSLGGEGLRFSSTYDEGSTFWFELDHRPLESRRLLASLSIKASSGRLCLSPQKGAGSTPNSPRSKTGEREEKPSIGTFSLKKSFTFVEGTATSSSSGKSGRVTRFDFKNSKLMKKMSRVPTNDLVQVDFDDLETSPISAYLLSATENMASKFEFPLRRSRFSSHSVGQLSSHGTIDEHSNTMVSGGEPCGCPSILIVDDQEFNRFALTSMLETFGLRADSAADGFEAIEKLRAATSLDCECGGYEIVFMDYQMPNLNGVGTMTLINEEISKGELNPITVIGLTGYTEEAERLEMLGSGMVDVLTKPVGRHGILTAINRWVSIGTEVIKLEQVSEYAGINEDEEEMDRHSEES